MTTAPSPAPRTVLVIDNYDSFTFNLVQLLRALDDTLAVRVVLNDRHMRASCSRRTPGAC